MLDSDFALVLKEGEPVVFKVRRGDVIHAFAIPTMGIKIDALPGRVNYE